MRLIHEYVFDITKTDSLSKSDAFFIQATLVHEADSPEQFHKMLTVLIKYLARRGIARRHGKGYSFEEFCKIITAKAT